MSELNLRLEVRGSEGIEFEEGWQTGEMKEAGLEIRTVYYASTRKLYGGCIDREQTKQLRDFLNKCIAKWDAESK